MRSLLIPFATACCFLMSSALFAAASKDVKKPNIIVIFSDDAGYFDFSYQGNKKFPTPNIDSIAKNGVNFTNGYVTAPSCSPSRAGLLTGRYQQRFGHETHIFPKYSETNGMPLAETTIADMLKTCGYRTIALGKWHLGYTAKFHPLSRGFTDYYGFLEGSRNYRPIRGNILNRLLRDRQPVKEKFEYLTDELGKEAVAYIDKHHKKPFFMYLAPNAVHTPMQAKPSVKLKADKTLKPASRRTLAAMTISLDEMVGNVLSALRRHKIEDNTLLFFINDNGGATINSSSNYPLRGFKGTHFEGGIRVPFLAQWPGKLPKGKVYANPVITLDVLPTAIDLAKFSGKITKPLDGVNLLPYLTGATPKAGVPHKVLHWRMEKKWAIRRGNYKLMQEDHNPPMLFNLANDLSEKTDLAAKEPQRVKALLKEHLKWDATLAKPIKRTRATKPPKFEPLPETKP